MNEALSRFINDSKNNGYFGSPNITIAIIDGAINGQHSDFSQSSITYLSNNLTARCQNSESPSCQHGTFITGVLAAGNQTHAPGICPQCSFIARPIFCEASDLSQCPLVDEQELSHAINECIDAGANIINLSVGLNGSPKTISDELKKAYQRAEENKVLLVAASGNQATNHVNSLFQHPWVIPVAAMDNHGRIEPSSNYGLWIAERGLKAPGSHILSTNAAGGYTTMSGTSVAAPFVTGVAALLWSRYPHLSASDIKNAVLCAPKFNNDNPEIPSLNPEQSLIWIKEYLNNKPKMDSDNNNRVSTLTEKKSKALITPQSCGCNNQPKPQWAYAIGILEPFFPDKGLQHEFDKAARSLKVSANDYFSVFNYRDIQGHRIYYYIAQKMLWHLIINSSPEYIVMPHTEKELNSFIQSLKPRDNTLQETLSAVIGLVDNTIEFEGFNSPLIICNHSFSFTMDELHEKLKNYANSDIIQDVIKNLEFHPNKGIDDSARARNFLAFSYPEIYEKTATQKSGKETKRKYFLRSIDTRHSPTSSNRNIIDIIFYYQSDDNNRTNNYFCSVDVSGQYPFIQSPIQTFLPAGPSVRA